MKIIKIFFLCFSLPSLQVIAEETLPTLSKIETLKYYIQNESYKSLAWSSLGAGTFIALHYGLSKKYPRLKELISKTQIAKGVITAYILPQLLNLKSTYALTRDI